MLRGYTIPLLDLANDTFRQSVVDREEGQYLGHPTTALLDDGRTIIAVYPKSHGRGPIVMKKSPDGGKTWGERLPVPASWATSLEVPTLYRTVGPDGKKHLILFSGLYPIRMAHSEDEGENWSELEPIGDFGGIVAMADLTEVGKGEYLAFFHDDGRFIKPDGTDLTEVYVTGEGPDAASRIVYSATDGKGGWVPYSVWNSSKKAESVPGTRWVKRFTTVSDVEGSADRRGRFTVYSVRSRDGGLSWGDLRVVCSHESASLCEPGVVRSPDGKQLAMLLRENSRRYNSFVTFSDDNGLNWSKPRELPGALTGDRHTIRRLKDGRLFVSFRDMCHESPTRGDWCGWVGTYEDIACGREGEYRVRLMKNHDGCDCAYPGVLVLPDGTVAATTYGAWTKGEKQYIVTVRFKPPVISA
ncbi:MAG: glycoside hydrolase [Clostridiales bacterium]|nr:glycoside hydrolase [Clostridiales bacterium]